MKKHGMKLLSGLLVLMLLVSIPGGLLQAGALDAGVDSSSASSVKAPPTAAKTVESVGEGAKADNHTGKNILVIETNSPWRTDANQSVLDKLVSEGYIDEYNVSSVLDSVYMDYSEYSMIMIANDQNFENYQNYDHIKHSIEKYAESGGVVLFGACDNGWADGILNSVLPGNVEKVEELCDNDYVNNPDNAFVSGQYYTKTPLEDSMLYCHYCSHVYFKEDTLPEGTDIILRSKDSDSPTLVEYAYGEGNVIASGLTWEYCYNNVGNNGYGQYYPDIILYALSFSDAKGAKPSFVTKDSGFNILIDGNNFCHTNDNSAEVFNSGFDGTLNYSMSDEYYNKLINNSSFGEKSAVKAYINYGNTGHFDGFGKDYWGGSCYGIATSMAMVYEKLVSLKDIAYTKAPNYHSLQYPRNDPKFLDVIQYYQVSQMLDKGGKVYARKARTVNDTKLTDQEYDYNNLRSFLKTLVAEGASGHVNVLGFSKPDCGHAVLVTGCKYDEKNEKYLVEIYDENTVGFLTKGKKEADVQGKYSYMEISKDYRYFDWNGLNNDTYIEMYLTDLNYVKKLDGSVKGTEVKNNDNPRVFIFLSLADTFQVENQQGEKLAYDGRELSGDMRVYAVNTIENAMPTEENASPYICFEVDASDNFTVGELQQTVDVQMFNDDNFMSLKGEKIDNATLSFNDGINIAGNDYSFSAFVNTDEEVNEGEKNLVALSAKASGETAIKVEGNKAVANNENGLKDIALSNYVGSEAAFTQVEDTDSVSVDNIYATQDHSKPVLDKEELTLTIGQTATVKATVTPSDAPDKTVKWSTNNSKVATVTQKGVITAKSVGTALITATTANGNTAICVVDVNYATPKITKAENTASGVKLTWNKVKGAEKYRVFVKSGKSWKKLGDTTANTFTDKKAKSGTKYTYTVRSVTKDGMMYTSGFDTTGKTVTFLSAPKLSKVTNTNSGQKVTWSKVKGAVKYRVYVKNGKSWKKLGDTTAASFVNKKAKSGTKYTYTVRCISKNGKENLSAFNTTGKTLTFVASPKITKVQNTASGQKLTWAKVKGAAKYRVFVKDGKSWKKLGDTAAVSFVNKKAKSGKTYTYTVRAMNAKKAFVSDCSTKGWKKQFIAVPAGTKVKNTKNGVQVSWKKVAGAAKYRVYRKTAKGKWTKAGDTAKLSFVDKSAKKGVKYTYSVCCITKNGKSATSDKSAGKTIVAKR